MRHFRLLKHSSLPNSHPKPPLSLAPSPMVLLALLPTPRPLVTLEHNCVLFDFIRTSSDSSPWRMSLHGLERGNVEGPW